MGACSGRGSLDRAGELSGVIAGLVGLTLPTVTFVPLATAYVLLSALLGPLVVHRLPREG